MAVTWIKTKYATEKTKGKFKSSHNDGRRAGRARRRKLSDRERAAVQARQPSVTLVLLPSGKRRFERRDQSRT